MALIAVLPMAACADRGPAAEDLIPEYLGIRTLGLDENLVHIDVEMTNALTEADVEDYADCAVAGYTLRQGWAFARHLRTKVDEVSGVWRADAVYTISPTRPRGLVTLEADEVAKTCAEKGIPTS